VKLTVDPRADGSVPYSQGFLNPQGQVWITGPSSVAQTAPAHLAELVQARGDPVWAWSACWTSSRNRLAVLGGQAAAIAAPRQDRRGVEGETSPGYPTHPL
jgi:hypothetical protein